MLKSNCRVGVLASAILLWAAPLALAASQLPNVVFILADNVGYGDLGPYGGGELRGAPTPRIDQFAREGLKLTQFLMEPAWLHREFHRPLDELQQRHRLAP